MKPKKKPNSPKSIQHSTIKQLRKIVTNNELTDYYRSQAFRELIYRDHIERIKNETAI